ncbi:MAG: carboxypeptidase regulatory-like domain-containing protein [Planctomycetaceae bacterium]|nr:carboxypeptidase regulatory-like domain-containing protein [Planctomycetaceae bacterium]
MTRLSCNALTFVLMMAALAVSSSQAHAQANAEKETAASSAPAPLSTEPLKTFDRPAISIIDVALNDEGLVRGRVLTAEGKPVDGAQVVIRREDELLHKMITNEQGQFSAKGLRPGVYTIATVSSGGLYRLWPKTIAPPAAREQALLMVKEPVVRAQYGSGALAAWTSIGVGVAGLTVGIISLDKINDLEDEVNSLKSP